MRTRLAEVDVSGFEIGAQERDALAESIASVRVAAYVGRLRQVAGAIGLPAPNDVDLTDPDILAQIAEDSRREAEGIAATWNRDLAAEVARLKQTDEGVTKGAVLKWNNGRAEWKAHQIVEVQVAKMRTAADADLRERNQITQVWLRAVPRDSRHDACIALIQRGWVKPEGAPSLPLHPNCRHSWEQSIRFADAGDPGGRVWIGAWIDGERDKQQKRPR